MRRALRSVQAAMVVLLASALCAVCLAFAWAPERAAAAEATPTVIYDATSGEFSFRDAPGGDLFASFKGLMPGDVAEQQVAVEVVNSREIVSVYVSARYADAELAGIEDVGLTATFDGSGAHTGTLGDRHEMGEPVKMATLRGDDAATGVVELRVPTSLGNDTAGGAHTLTWEFTAQHEGALPPGDDGAASDGAGSGLSQTGDGLGGVVIAITAIAVIALIVVIVAAVAARKKRR